MVNLLLLLALVAVISAAISVPVLMQAGLITLPLRVTSPWQRWLQRTGLDSMWGSRRSNALTHPAYSHTREQLKDHAMADHDRMPPPEPTRQPVDPPHDNATWEVAGWDRQEAIAVLAGRGHALIERQRSLLAAPDLPAQQLFAIRHLAAQIQRCLDGVALVSGGQHPGRATGPVQLSHVVHAAALAIPACERVQVDLTHDPAIAPQAVDGLIHLLAELLDPLLTAPTAQAVVRCEKSRDGLELVIGDEPSPESTLTAASFELTEAHLALANRCLLRPTGRQSSAQELAFCLAGELARTLGMAVRLGRTWSGGTAVTVPLPGAILLQPRGDQQTAPAWPSHAGEPAMAADPVHARAATPAPVFGEVNQPVPEALAAFPQQAQPRPQVESFIDQASIDPYGHEDDEELGAGEAESAADPGRSNRRRRRGPRRRTGVAGQATNVAAVPQTMAGLPSGVTGASINVLPGSPIPAPRRAEPISSVPQNSQVPQVAATSSQAEPENERVPVGVFAAPSSQAQGAHPQQGQVSSAFPGASSPDMAKNDSPFPSSLTQAFPTQAFPMSEETSASAAPTPTQDTPPPFALTGDDEAARALRELSDSARSPLSDKGTGQ